MSPNFIVINTDNLGYGDLGCYGSQTHDTPRLDRMAAEGVRFTHFYVTSGVCTPSRASLMTGCYAQRVGMHTNGAGGCVLFPIASRGLSTDETTIPKTLSRADYRSVCIGKWHLGDQPEFLPRKHGFDEYFGIPYSEDMKHTRRDGWPPLPLMRNEEVVEAPADLSTITERYTQESVEYIRSHAAEPFFLYLAHATPGSERTAQVSARFGGTSRNGAYGDSVHELDWSTGRILDAVDEAGIAERTLVIFMSDNGAVRNHGGSNAPLAGWGYSTDEGGMRVPCLMRWTGTMPERTVCDRLTTAMDFLPTFTSLAGVPAATDRKIDGHDASELLRRPDEVESPYTRFFYYQMEQLQAVRSEEWKLCLALDDKINHGRKSLGPVPTRLFDVVQDPGEQRDLSGSHPDVVRRLAGLAQEARRTLGDTGIPGAEQRAPGEVADPTPRVMAGS